MQLRSSQLIHTLFRYGRLLLLLAGMHLKVSIIYRKDVALWAVVSIIWTLFNFFFFSVLVQVRGEIAGWSQSQMFVLIGVFTILDAFIWSWLSSSMQQMTESIYLGSLDLVLVRPVDTQFYLSFSRFNYTNLVRITLGLSVLLINLRLLQLYPTILQWLLAITTMAASLTVLYSFWFMASTFAFFADRMENIHEVIPSLRRFMEVPAPVFQGFLGKFLTFVLPILILTNVPANILLGRIPYRLVAYLFVFAVATVLVTRWWFHHCLRHYSGVGS